MWQSELVQSAGSGRTAPGLNSRTWHFRATYSYAEGVTTTLSLPWSLFEHMAGNFLMGAQRTMEDPSAPNHCQLATVIEATTEQPPAFSQVSLPSVQLRELRGWLEAGRAALSHPGVREFEGEGGLPIKLTVF